MAYKATSLLHLGRPHLCSEIFRSPVLIEPLRLHVCLFARNLWWFWAGRPFVPYIQLLDIVTLPCATIFLRVP